MISTQSSLRTCGDDGVARVESGHLYSRRQNSRTVAPAAAVSPAVDDDVGAPAAADVRPSRRLGRAAAAAAAAGDDGRRRDEQPAERLPELLAHGAVDEEVERVAEEDDDVGDERGGAARARVHQHQRVERVLDDHRHHHDGERQLDEQEDADDDDEHQRRHVGLGEPARLRLQVVAQQATVVALGAPHRHEQARVEPDQQDARHDVDERDAEVPAARAHVRSLAVCQSARYRWN